ncbi:hypothetical protein M9458_022863, partial [Cirrhinus mrigala]
VSKKEIKCFPVDKPSSATTQRLESRLCQQDVGIIGIDGQDYEDKSPAFDIAAKR